MSSFSSVLVTSEFALTIGSLSKHDVETARTSSESITSRFFNHFSVIQSPSACKMCSTYPGIQLEPVLQREEKIEHLSSFAHVVHAVVQK